MHKFSYSFKFPNPNPNPAPTYPCRSEGCGRTSTYYAKGNEAIYGHVCGNHYEELSEKEQESYAHVFEVLKSKRW